MSDRMVDVETDDASVPSDSCSSDCICGGTSSDRDDSATRLSTLQEAEAIIKDIESDADIPEHLREVVVARANDAFSMAKCGKSPEKAICEAVRAMRCMNNTSATGAKVQLLSCALEKISGANANSFLKKVQACMDEKAKKQAEKNKEMEKEKKKKKNKDKKKNC